jgi:hypothetical protein
MEFIQLFIAVQETVDNMRRTIDFLQSMYYNGYDENVINVALEMKEKALAIENHLLRELKINDREYIDSNIGTLLVEIEYVIENPREN